MKTSTDTSAESQPPENGQANEVLSQWQRFVRGQLPDSLRPVISESWLRCRGAGVDPGQSRLHRVAEEDLRQRLKSHAELLTVSRPHLDWVSSALSLAPHVVYLTDGDGVVLHSVGSCTRMQELGLHPGYGWSERAMGTNGAGTALAVNQPVTVIGPEHYCSLLHDYASMGAPLHASDGSVIGAIDVQTGVADGNQEHLVLVAHVAYSIDRELACRERERVTTAEALRQNAERLQFLADALPVLISYVDADRRYQFNNAAYERWFGVPRHATWGRHMWEVLGDDAYRAIEGHVAAALAGRPQAFEARVPYRTTGPRDVHVDYVPHWDADGRVAGFYALIVDVTERRRAEDALKESEERLRLAVEVTGMGVWSAEMPNPSRYEWSPHLKAIWGVRPDIEITPELVWSLVHPDDQDTVRRAMERSLDPRGDGRFAVEHRVCRPDGTIAWVQAWGRTLFEGPMDARRPTRSVGVILDISARKRVEETLRKSEELIRSILNALSAHIAVLDGEGNIIAVNSAWERFARANGDPAQVRSGVGANYLEVCRRAAKDDPDLAMQVLAGLERVLDGTSPAFSIEYPCHSPAEQRWFLLHATPLPVAVGGAVVSHTSVTDLKSATVSLHESEERFRAFMDNTSASAWMKDEEGRYVYLNKPFENHFGVRLEDWRGKTDFDVWPQEIAEEFRRNDQEVLRSGQPREVIEHTLIANGRDRTWLTSKFLFRDGSGRTFVGGIGFDITERKELEREVLEIAALEQRRIGQELHDDVGQELTGLGLLADALAHRLTAQSPADAVLAEKLVRGIGRARRQVRSLSHGLVPVEVEPEGLRTALEELAASSGASSGCTCTFESAGPLTVTDPDLATHLFRIAQEAVSNALQHSRARRIRIALVADADALTLSVTDDGVGISGPPLGVKGLGLRLMRYRAGVIGGKLTVAPAADGGTIVSCRIPGGAKHGH